MLENIRRFVVYAWNFVFDHEISPVRNIKDVAVRHYILQILGSYVGCEFFARDRELCVYDRKRYWSYCFDRCCGNYGCDLDNRVS